MKKNKPAKKIITFPSVDEMSFQFLSHLIYTFSFVEPSEICLV